MTTFQIINVVLISVTLILAVFLIFNLVVLILKKRELATFLKQKRRKNKKRAKKKKFFLERKIKKQWRRIIMFVVLEILFIASVVGVIYYQNINISSSDSDLVVRGYFLVDDFTKEIEKASTSEDEESTKQNIKYLALSMATYSNKSADVSNTKEGQRMINKYYKMIGQLGMNATRDINSFHGNQNNVLDSYKSELARVKESENKAFEFYKINANSLENQEQKKE